MARVQRILAACFPDVDNPQIHQLPMILLLLLMSNINRQQFPNRPYSRHGPLNDLNILRLDMCLCFLQWKSVIKQMSVLPDNGA